jgi:LuxR family maltose regulon positive regulatory protein
VSSPLVIAPAPPAGLSAAAPPRLRAGIVARPRLLARLAAATDAPIVTLVAPAGYGKTTLLAQWARADERPFVWLSLATQPVADAIAALVAMLDGAPGVLVVDDAHLADPHDMRKLLLAAAALPEGSAVALATRRPLGEPVGRLRAQRLLVELGLPELAMTPLEAALLVRAAGSELAGGALDALYRQTEGWAAALDLATTADDDAGGFSGADRLVAELLRDELLAGLTAPQRSFLRRTAILPRLTAPLCDAVLESSGSARVLADLVRAGLPLAPLDRYETGFRCHPLLTELLRAELARVEPDLEPRLHARAAAWHAARGEPAEALEHAVAGRDRAAVAQLLWSLAPAQLARGEEGLLGRRLGLFGAREIGRDPTLSILAAAHHLAEGRRARAELSLASAEREGPGDDDAAVATLVLRACIARGGVSQMAADAARAGALAAPESHWQSVALLLDGVARQLGGDSAGSVEPLTGALCRAAELPAVAAAAHAQLALCAAEAETWPEAREHVEAAHAALAAGAPLPVRALTLALDAVVATERGEIAQARNAAADARRLLASAGDFPPWLLAEAHAWLARAEIRLSDGPAARMLLARGARLAAQVPSAAALARWIHEGWALADAFAAAATGDGPTLTNAELKVLRFLPSHLSFREIGERLHLSTNTVKTQALAVYRKLDVSCRSDAVARGRVAGLIDG